LAFHTFICTYPEKERIMNKNVTNKELY
jgi:hypothetical protein